MKYEEKLFLFLLLFLLSLFAIKIERFGYFVLFQIYIYISKPVVNIEITAPYTFQ